MPQKQEHGRVAWLDQYNEPDLKDLRKQLVAESQRLFDDARKKLLGFESVTEHAVWYGDCWHWTVEYRLPRLEIPLAVIIPSPEDLQLAVPFSPVFSEQVSIGRMKRAVRDGFDLAREPYDTRWGVWSLVPGSLLSELMDLVKQKIKFHQSGKN